MLGCLRYETQLSNLTIIIVCIYDFRPITAVLHRVKANTVFTARVDPVSAPSQRYISVLENLYRYGGAAGHCPRVRKRLFHSAFITIVRQADNFIITQFYGEIQKNRSEIVLAAANFGKNLLRCGIGHSDSLFDIGMIATQKRIDRFFNRQHRGHSRLILCPHFFNFAKIAF